MPKPSSSRFLKLMIDPQKRAVYDQYGEEGLKGGVPPPESGATYFSTGGGPTSFSFNPRSADDIFWEFSGFSSPFGGIWGGAGMRGSRFGGMFDDNMFASFEGGGSGPGGSMHQQAIKKHLQPCTLEELYKGTTKKMKISREIFDANSGKIVPVEELLTIDVKTGWKKGTKLTFPDKGNDLPGVAPVDLVFIIDEKPHRVFTRDGNDLVLTKKSLSLRH